ncbi:hypothetical protein AB0M94_35375 [Streptomyces xanthochromogenes]|uniref:hypothetical protein n=1 Tax=Streptomyces xanthochromogenes TaxID=67384 RepID=UPI00343EA420
MRPTGMNRRPRPAIALAVVLVSGLVLTACGKSTRVTTPESTPSSTIQPISRGAVLAPDGETITTVIPVGGCQKGRLTGTESQSTVTLSLSLTTHQKAGEVCAANIRLDHVSYKLQAPLSNRMVLDNATGKPLTVTKQ